MLRPGTPLSIKRKQGVTSGVAPTPPPTPPPAPPTPAPKGTSHVRLQVFFFHLLFRLSCALAILLSVPRCWCVRSFFSLCANVVNLLFELGAIV